MGAELGGYLTHDFMSRTVSMSNWKIMRGAQEEGHLDLGPGVLPFLQATLLVTGMRGKNRALDPMSFHSDHI